MYCRICGTDKWVEFRMTHMWCLCDLCHLQSAVPIAYSDFDSRYWNPSDDVSPLTRREFYSDYKSSGLTFEMYRNRTSEKL